MGVQGGVDGTSASAEMAGQPQLQLCLGGRQQLELPLKILLQCMRGERRRTEDAEKGSACAYKSVHEHTAELLQTNLMLSRASVSRKDTDAHKCNPSGLPESGRQP